MTRFAAAFTSLVAVVAAVTSFGRPYRANEHMFRGNHPTRVDEKGRLKVPAEFKRVIDEKYGTQFYITSLDGKVAQVYPFEEWERIEQKLAGLSTFNPTKKKFLSRVNYWGQQVEMDGQGRLLMPQLLRDAAQIKGEVAVSGQPDVFGSAQHRSVTTRKSRTRSSRPRMRRRSTIWASSGRGFNKHPSGGWAWRKLAMFRFF